MGERLPCKQEASGSNPLISTSRWVEREEKEEDEVGLLL